jgi:hypothetical protein
MPLPLVAKVKGAEDKQGRAGIGGSFAGRSRGRAAPNRRGVVT